MSSFVGLAPVVRIRVRNVLLKEGYPSVGSVETTVPVTAALGLNSCVMFSRLPPPGSKP